MFSALKRGELETDFTHQLVHHADTGVPPTITNLLQRILKDPIWIFSPRRALNDSNFPRNPLAISPCSPKVKGVDMLRIGAIIAFLCSSRNLLLLSDRFCWNSRVFFSFSLISSATCTYSADGKRKNSRLFLQRRVLWTCDGRSAACNIKRKTDTMYRGSMWNVIMVATMLPLRYLQILSAQSIMD